MKEKSTLKDVANNYLTHPLKNKGITLITLVITIIIIIILATITLNLAVGDGGLIKQAETTKNLTESTTNKVSGLMSNLTAYLEEEFKEPETPPQHAGSTIEEALREGNRVYYQDATGTTRECVVLYGPENAKYSTYGIQIVTMETVENVTLGSSDYTTARDQYNDVINLLNNATSKYLNTTYAESVRCVGSVPNDPSYDGAGMFTSSYSYMTSYNGIFKDYDVNYLTDWNQMKKLNIANISKSYWIPSRDVYTTSNGSNFNIRYRSSSSSSEEPNTTIFVRYIW